MKNQLKILKLALLAISSAMVIISSGSGKVKMNLENPKVKKETLDSDFRKNIGFSALDNQIKKIEKEEKQFQVPKVEKKEITISAVGDCTLGTDTNFGYNGSFTDILDSNHRDFSYFFQGVNKVLSKDDLTIANLETTFTDSTTKVTKKFNFKGDFDYTNILKSGSVEVVNLANNHTYDYGEEGYTDTIEALKKANIPYFGYEDYSIIEVQEMQIGLAGITGWDETSAKENTEKAIQYFHENNTDLIILTYHWGIEREYKQNVVQESIGRYAIEKGADLVIGHHPHVLQGIEQYQGKYIVYSLGNFVFGGNRNPSDKDTMIFQETFSFEDGVLIDTEINIIPCSLSSRSDLNDYQPVISQGSEYTRILEKVLESSTNVKESDFF